MIHWLGAETFMAASEKVVVMSINRKTKSTKDAGEERDSFSILLRDVVQKDGKIRFI